MQIELKFGVSFLLSLCSLEISRNGFVASQRFFADIPGEGGRNIDMMVIMAVHCSKCNKTFPRRE